MLDRPSAWCGHADRSHRYFASTVSLDSAAGERLFEDILERFVRPELVRRIDAGKIAQDTLVYRFQVLLHSSARWRGVISAITWPEATSRAA